MKTTPIVLASTSKYRRELLTRLGLPFVELVFHQKQSDHDHGYDGRMKHPYLLRNYAQFVCSHNIHCFSLPVLDYKVS